MASLGRLGFVGSFGSIAWLLSENIFPGFTVRHAAREISTRSACRASGFPNDRGVRAARKPQFSLLRRKRQQYVSRHPAVARITGINKQHAAGDHWAGTVERSALGFNSVHSGIALGGVEVPKYFTVFSRKGAQVSINRTRENHAGNGRDRL